MPDQDLEAQADGGTCVWKFEGGTWTVIDQCDHASGFSCGAAVGRGDSSASNLVVITPIQISPGVMANKFSVSNINFFKSQVVMTFQELGMGLTQQQSDTLGNPSEGSTIEVPCTKKTAAETGIANT